MNNFFQSPTTGNAVTWNSAGQHTDTGTAYDQYQMPTGPQRIGGGGEVYSQQAPSAYTPPPGGNPNAIGPSQAMRWRPIGGGAEFGTGGMDGKGDMGSWAPSGGATTVGGGGSNSPMNLGMGGGVSPGGGSGGGGQNPYLRGMGDNIVNQMTDNFTRNQLPAMRSGAMAAGGFGGSRQGVIEANGLKDLNMGIGQNLTNLYGQDWTNGQNRNLQQQSINNSYDLGLKSNDLGFANLDSNNQQFGANFGLNTLNAQNNWANQGVQTANGIQNAPIDYSRYFGGQANQTAGQGGSTTNSQTTPGNPYIGAIGGAQLVNSWLK